MKKARVNRHPVIKTALLVGGLLLASLAWAALPPPTPAQQQAAAEKKAKADAQAAKDKESLTASMDAVAGHWRSRAAQQGWKTHPPVAIAAAAPAAVPAAAAAPAAGAAVTAAGSAPDPALAAAKAGIIKSEKLGTAPPSEDVKQHPTQAQPRNIAPTVQKGSPDNVSKK